jgi:hypothetical protein
MRLDEGSILQFLADDDIAADRNSLARNDCVDRMNLLATGELLSC